MLICTSYAYQSNADNLGALVTAAGFDLSHIDAPAMHAVFAAMREEGDGIHTVEPLGTMFFRYADVAEIFAKPEQLSSAIFLDGPQAEHDAGDARQSLAVETVGNILLFLDAPSHTRLRSLVRHAFSAKAILLWQKTVERVVDEVIAELEQYRGEIVDYNETVAHVVPIRVISEILGVDAGDRPHFKQMTTAFVNVFDAAVTGAARAEALDLAGELAEFTMALIEARRGAPRDDLVGLLIAAEEGGDKLTSEELVSSIAALLAGGSHTIVAMLGNGIQFLHDNPEQLELVMRDHEKMAGAVDEIIRLEPSGRWTGRVATEPVDIGGRRFQPGDVVWAGMASANRDPRQFPDPERFDVERHPNRHLGFGRGVHYCLGAQLARLQGRVVLPRMFEAFPGLSVMPDGQTWNNDFISPSRITMPVRL